MTDQHLEPRSNPSQNSQLRASTDIQSSVSPEDYPAEDRKMHSLGATSGAPAGGGPDDAQAPAPKTAPTTPGKAEGDDETSPPEEGSPEG